MKDDTLVGTQGSSSAVSPSGDYVIGSCGEGNSVEFVKFNSLLQEECTTHSLCYSRLTRVTVLAQLIYTST